MGERAPEAAPVFIVPEPTPGGRPSDAGLLRSLYAEGICRGLIPDSRAQGVTQFVPIFDKSDVLKPIQSSTQQISDTAGGPVVALVSTILAPIDRVVVIRSLAWTVAATFGDLFRVRFAGREDNPLFFAQLEHEAPIPSSQRVIGDTASALTAEFNRLLPIALLPGDSIIFTQIRTIAAVMTNNLTWRQQNYIAPFRPAGL